MYNIYHINLADNITLEVPAESEKEALRIALFPTNVISIYAMPVTSEITLGEDELEYTHAIGDITYIIKHIVDSDNEFYEVELGQATEEWHDEIDHETVSDIRSKLEMPFGFGYFTKADALKDIAEAIDETYDIYDEAIKY